MAYDDKVSLDMSTRSITGVLVKTPKVIKLDPCMLVLSIQEEQTDTMTHCLLVKHALNFMYQAEVGCRIAVFGHFNQRQQLIVDRFMLNHGITH